MKASKVYTVLHLYATFYAELPYSPDLAPSDYHLFPGLKKTIEGSPVFVRR